MSLVEKVINVKLACANAQCGRVTVGKSATACIYMHYIYVTIMFLRSVIRVKSMQEEMWIFPPVQHFCPRW